jgi:hypothetical protein
MPYLTASDVARRLGVRPRDVSDLFYSRRLGGTDCPLVGGRRLIPEDFLPAIAAALRTRPRGPAGSAGPRPQGDPANTAPAFASA